MSKVIGPLGSFGASGQIGKLHVFFPWKGLNVVRQYIVPSNPNTALQQAARQEFTDGVDSFHQVAWTASDLAGFRLWASTANTPMSGFNRYMKQYIEDKNPLVAWRNPVDLLAAVNGAGGLVISHAAANQGDWDARVGTSKLFFPTTADMTFNVGTGRWEVTVAGLVVGVRHYVWVFQKGPGNVGRSGIISQIVT